MAGKAGLSGLALAEIVSGLLLVYTGIYALPMGYTIKSIISGKAPPVSKTGANILGKPGPGGQPSVEQGDLSYTGQGSSGTSPAGDTGSAVANLAVTFVGHKYIFGGPSNPQTGWDCSSFVSYILGHTGFNIPGGSWASVTNNGASHGPDVASYVMWGGATSISKSEVAAGDLIMYPPNTHIGIATSNTEFVSAEDPADGTGVAPISAGPGAWIAHRLTGVAPGGSDTPKPLPHGG